MTYIRFVHATDESLFCDRIPEHFDPSPALHFDESSEIPSSIFWDFTQRWLMAT
jgi:hypothetical protein